MSTTVPKKIVSAPATGKAPNAPKAPKEKKGDLAAVAPETSGKVAKKPRGSKKKEARAEAEALTAAAAVAAAAAAVAAAADEEPEPESESADGLDAAELTPEEAARRERAKDTARQRRKKVRAKKIMTEFVLKKFRPGVNAQRKKTSLVIRAGPFTRLVRAALYEANQANSKMPASFGNERVSNLGTGTVALLQNVIEEDFTSLLEAAVEVLCAARKKKVTEGVLRATLAVQGKSNRARFDVLPLKQ
jgi:hypothetical protein